jgi:transposase
MKALDYGEIITESVEQLQVMLKKAHQPLIRRRLRFLLLLKQHKGMSRAAAGKKLGLLPSGAQDMWELYRKAGIESFTAYPFKGRPAALNQDQKIWLQEELKKQDTTSLSVACQMVEAHTGVHYGVSGMHYVFKCLGVKKKTGRPSHVNHQPQQAEVFKKRLCATESQLWQGDLL